MASIPRWRSPLASRAFHEGQPGRGVARAVLHDRLQLGRGALAVALQELELGGASDREIVGRQPGLAQAIQLARGAREVAPGPARAQQRRRQRIARGDQLGMAELAGGVVVLGGGDRE